MPDSVPTLKHAATQSTSNEVKENQRNNRLTVLETHGYFLGKTVGSGSYATVRIAYSEKDEKDVAIKIVSKESAPEDYLRRFLPREIQVGESLFHPNLIRYENTC